MGFDDILCTKNESVARVARRNVCLDMLGLIFRAAILVSRFARISFDRFFNTYIIDNHKCVFLNDQNMRK